MNLTITPQEWEKPRVLIYVYGTRKTYLADWTPEEARELERYNVSEGEEGREGADVVAFITHNAVYTQKDIPAMNRAMEEYEEGWE